MKLIEKLAKEYADPLFISEFEGYSVDAPEAFEAGFRKGVELALEVIRDTYNEGVEYIRFIPDEEVE